MSILSFILLLLLGAGLIALWPREQRVAIRAIALATTSSRCLAMWAFAGFISQRLGGFKYVHRVAWVDALGIDYLVGMDGINIGLILMAAIVSFAAVCVSHSIEERFKEFHFLMFHDHRHSRCLHVHRSVFFYFFHELALIPTFIMIGVWGRGEQRQYATYKMTLYLTLGALVALAGLVLLYIQSGAKTFDLRPGPATRSAATAARISEPYFWSLAGRVWYLGFALAFHSWAPIGYGAAPTATAMLHAGVLKKFGIYGSSVAVLLPQGAQAWAHLLGWLCWGNILYCGWVYGKRI